MNQKRVIEYADRWDSYLEMVERLASCSCGARFQRCRKYLGRWSCVRCGKLERKDEDAGGGSLETFRDAFLHRLAALMCVRAKVINGEG